jgi:hypothetical protein
MVSRSKLVGIAIIAVLLFALSVSLVAAVEYTTEKVTDVTVGSDGTFTASEPDVGISYEITGTAGATGTVTADVYNGNPQPTADIPSGVSLTSFIVLTFDMNPLDFSQATITISYTALEVQNINPPYTIYKYVSSSNSYVALPTTVDTEAKTLTVTLNSVTDPLLAIGGTAKPSTTGGGSSMTWILVSVSIILIVVAAVAIVITLRPSKKPKYPNNFQGQIHKPSK